MISVLQGVKDLNNFGPEYQIEGGKHSNTLDMYYHYLLSFLVLIAYNLIWGMFEIIILSKLNS